MCGVTPPWRLQGSKQHGETPLKGSAKVASLITAELGIRYLSTIELEVCDKFDRPQKVRLLLDNCATHSYGLENTVSRLPVVERQNSVDMTVSTFSGLRKISAKVVDLKLPGDISISLAVTDHICEPLSGQELDHTSRGVLGSYQLADPACITGKSLPIDILIGVDNYWKI